MILTKSINLRFNWIAITGNFTISLALRELAQGKEGKSMQIDV